MAGTIAVLFDLLARKGRARIPAVLRLTSERDKAPARGARLAMPHLRRSPKAVADDNPPVRITSADLKYSADARAGLATATFEPNPVDPNFPSVTITYADGAYEYVGMTNMSALGGSWDWPMNSWRMNIGTDVTPGPPAIDPQPARGIGSEHHGSATPVAR